MATEDVTAIKPIVINGVDITKPHKDWIGKCTPTPIRKSAIFWRAFHIADDERNGRGKLFAACNVCGHVLISHNSGTTNLRRHFRSRHKEINDRLLELSETYENKNCKSDNGAKPGTKRQAQLSEISLMPRHKKQKRKAAKPVEKAELAQAMYCIAANRPLYDLDQPALRSFVESCVEVGRHGGQFIPSASKAQVRAKEAAKVAKSAMLAKFKEAEKLMASINIWESRDNRTTVRIGIHWIEDFALRHCVLSSTMHKSCPTHEIIVDSFLENLRQWEIKDKIAFLVHNLKLSDSETARLGDVVILCCLDKHLQQITEGILLPALRKGDIKEKEVEELEDSNVINSISKARALVQALKLRNKVKFEGNLPDAAKAANQFVLVEDLMSCWWSTVEMIERLLSCRADIESITRDRESTGSNELSGCRLLTTEEWKILDEVHAAIKPLCMAVKMLGGNNNSTLSLVPFIQYVIHNELNAALRKSHNAFKEAGTIAAQILKNFQAKFGKTVTIQPEIISAGLDRVTFIAHALDPRFKQLKVMSCKEDQTKLWDMVLEEMIALEPSASQQTTNDGGTEKDGTDANTTGDVIAASILTGVLKKEESKREEEPVDNIFDQYAGVLESSTQENSDSWESKCRNELNLYRAESTIGMRTSNGKENPLSWWKCHRVAFPRLWTLAKVYLAVPATSADPRLSFSTQNIDMASQRYELEKDLPEDYSFLYENDWILSEPFGFTTHDFDEYG